LGDRYKEWAEGWWEKLWLEPSETRLPCQTGQSVYISQTRRLSRVKKKNSQMWAEGVGKEEVGTDVFLLHFPKIGLHLKELE